MEDYEYRVINLHATLFLIISKSTSETNQNPYRCVYRGHGGGRNPPTEPLPGCIPPPKRGGAHGAWAGANRAVARRSLQTQVKQTPVDHSALANPKGQPLGGVSPRILPRMAPLILGLPGFARSIY